MRVPTPDVMRERLGSWLSTFGISAPSGRVPGLRKLADVRAANTTTVDHLSRAAAPLVFAWCRIHDTEAPSWASGGPRALSLELQHNGVLDFRKLDLAAVLDWLPKVAGTWPASMPLTRDPDRLGLTRNQVSAAAAELANQGEPSKAKVRRSVPLDGHEVSLADDGAADLLARVDGSLGSLLEVPPEIAQTGPLPEGRGDGGGRGGRGGAASETSLSDAQREIIGFIGELVAYRWLCRHLGDGRVTWCSGLALSLRRDAPR